MMRILLLAPVLVVLVHAHAAVAQQTRPAEPDNAELRSLFEADQGARSGQIAPDLMVQDRQRRQRVRELLDSGHVRTARDHFHAAMVFQHGEGPDDYKLAHELAKKAAELDPSLATAKWLCAAAMDRYLRSIGEPQIYGTQYMVMHGVWALQPIDESAVTDEQRAALGVPSLAAARKKVATENARRQLAENDNRELDALLVEFVTEQVNVARPGEAADSARMRQIARETSALVDAGAVKTARDLSSAIAILEQFAKEIEDYRRLLLLAEEARATSPDDPQAGLTYARAFDRLRVAEGKDQWYGTFALSPQRTASGRWEPPNMDPESTVTDEERARLGIPPLQSWGPMVERLNREHAATRPAGDGS